MSFNGLLINPHGRSVPIKYFYSMHRIKNIINRFQ